MLGLDAILVLCETGGDSVTASSSGSGEVVTTMSGLEDLTGRTCWKADLTLTVDGCVGLLALSSGSLVSVVLGGGDGFLGGEAVCRKSGGGYGSKGG